MKQAICEKCGKRLPGIVPDDAINIICFDCCYPDQFMIRRRRKKKTDDEAS